MDTWCLLYPSHSTLPRADGVSPEWRITQDLWPLVDRALNWGFAMKWEFIL